jgi:hypothetical protein
MRLKLCIRHLPDATHEHLARQLAAALVSRHCRLGIHLAPVDIMLTMLQQQQVRGLFQQQQLHTAGTAA